MISGPHVFMAFLPIAFLALVALLATAFWIWMLVDCATKEPSGTNDKVVWILVIVLTHLLGAILYFLIRRPQRIKETGK